MPIGPTAEDSWVATLAADLSSKAGTSHTHTGTYESAGAVASHTAAADPHPTYTHSHPYAATDHTHAGGAHTHAEADVTGLATDLAAKAASSHAHAESDVTSLVTDLSGKAATAHTHAYEPSGAVATHAAAADPHTGYLTPAEGNAAYSLLGHTHAGGSSADTYVVLGSDQANSTVTPASAAGLATVVGPGTYLYKYSVCFRSAATTTGIEMFLTHTGTTTRLASTWYTLTTGGAAATGVADQATTLTAQMMEGKGQRVSGAASGPMQGVDTANADQFAVIEGLIIVTVSGTLQLMFRSEVAASAVTLMTGTTLTLTKVA